MNNNQKCLKFIQHKYKKNICSECFCNYKDHSGLTLEEIESAKYSESDNLPCYIIENIYMGSMYAALNIDKLKEYNITHVINCAQTLSKFIPNFVEYRNDFTYLSLPMIDSLEFVITEYIKESLKFINEAINQNGNVFIHCAQGKSRSGCIVIAYLMNKYKICYDDAYKIAKKGRILCNPNCNFKYQLIQMQKDGII